jgi:hypothetical protein
LRSPGSATEPAYNAKVYSARFHGNDERLACLLTSDHVSIGGDGDEAGLANPVCTLDRGMGLIGRPMILELLNLGVSPHK